MTSTIYIYERKHFCKYLLTQHTNTGTHAYIQGLSHKSYRKSMYVLEHYSINMLTNSLNVKMLYKYDETISLLDFLSLEVDLVSILYSTSKDFVFAGFSETAKSIIGFDQSYDESIRILLTWQQIQFVFNMLETIEHISQYSYKIDFIWKVVSGHHACISSGFFHQQSTKKKNRCMVIKMFCNLSCFISIPYSKTNLIEPINYYWWWKIYLP